MSEFDDVIQAARAGLEPSSRDRDRVWSRLSVRAGMVGATVALVTKASAGSSMLAGQTVGALVKLFVTSLGVTLVAGSAVVGVTRFRPTAHERVTAPAPLATSGPARQVAAASPGAATLAPAPSAAVPRSNGDGADRADRLPEAAARAAGDPSPPGRPEIARELALLRAVRQAASAGQHARAEHLLDELDRELPRGALLEERAALRAIAACEGAAASGRERARAFLRRYPASVYGQRVQQGCRDDAPAGKAADSATRSFTDLGEPGH
jgi:hypothetical protein